MGIETHSPCTSLKANLVRNLADHSHPIQESWNQEICRYHKLQDQHSCELDEEG
jgi:hypothetical protein